LSQRGAQLGAGAAVWRPRRDPRHRPGVRISLDTDVRFCHAGPAGLEDPGGSRRLAHGSSQQGQPRLGPCCQSARPWAIGTGRAETRTLKMMTSMRGFLVTVLLLAGCSASPNSDKSRLTEDEVAIPVLEFTGDAMSVI